MTPFADPALHERRQRRGFDQAATIEIGHAEARTGFILRMDSCTSAQQVNGVLDRAFEVAAEMPLQAITSPGWWAIIVGIAASERFRTELMRTPERAKLHCVMVVARTHGIVDNRPDWPLTRIGPTGYWTDHRGEGALRSPSRADLVEYAQRAGLPDTAGTYDDLVRAFDMGVVEFGDRPRFGGRRPLVSHA